MQVWSTIPSKIRVLQARNFVRSQPKKKKRKFPEFFSGANKHAVDLLERTLQLDVDKRITADEALRHPYVAKYHDESDEPTGEPFDDSFEPQDLTVQQWRGQEGLIAFYIFIRSLV